MPWVVVVVKPAASSSPATSSAVNRCSPRSLARSECPPSRISPGLDEVSGHRPGEHGGVPLADQQGEGAAGTQHRGDRRQGPGGVVDEAEHAVAQDEVDSRTCLRTGSWTVFWVNNPGNQLTQVVEVALQTGDAVGHVLLVGPTGERGEGVGAGVDDGDLVAEAGESDREPAGAATDVEDGLLLPGLAGAVEQRAKGIPDDRGAGCGPAFERAIHAPNPRGVIPHSRGCGATACGPPRR